MFADKRAGPCGIELVHQHDMRAAGRCRHGEGKAECTAERHGSQHRSAGLPHLQCRGDVARMPRDRALAMQHQFRRARRPASRECETWRFGFRAICAIARRRQRHNRMASDSIGRRVPANHPFERGALGPRYGGEKRGKIDGCEVPGGHERARLRALQQMPDLVRAKARVDMHGNRAEPRTSKDQREIIDAVWQPQSDAVAEADAAGGQQGRVTFGKRGELGPVQREASVARGRCLSSAADIPFDDGGKRVSQLSSPQTRSRGPVRARRPSR